MDTPIRIIKTLYQLKNGEKEDPKSFSADLVPGPYKCIFEFFETDVVSLEFEFDSSEYSVQYETYDTGEFREVEPYREYDFHNGQDPDGGAYFAGHFTVNVVKNGTVYPYYFSVRPRQLEYQNVINLRDFVNRYYSGLSLDLERKRRMTISVDNISRRENTFSNYHFILDNFPRLINHINSYIREKPEVLLKKEIISDHPVKFDSHSANWLIRKGYTRNAGIFRPRIFMSKKTEFSLNNEQNRFFKFQLRYWDSELKALSSTLGKYLNYLRSKIDVHENDLVELRNKVELLQDQKSVAKRVKDAEARKLEGAEEEHRKMLHQLEAYRNQYTQILHYKTYVENVEYNTWLKNIELASNYNEGRITNKKLLLIKEIRDRYIGIKGKNAIAGIEGKSRDFFAEKSTPKLFETYVYTLIITILNRLGFEIDEQGQQVGDLMYLLSNQSRLIMKSDTGLYCLIDYDRPLEKLNNNSAKTDYYAYNSTHNRPDFLISFYRETDRPLKTIIIDAKWRALRNIYNEYEDTEVMINLRDYSMFVYFDYEKKKIHGDVINNVLVFYPDYAETITDLMFGKILLCGLSIKMDIERTQSYQYIESLFRETVQSI